jgi:hypothetical protein
MAVLLVSSIVRVSGLITLNCDSKVSASSKNTDEDDEVLQTPTFHHHSPVMKSQYRAHCDLKANFPSGGAGGSCAMVKVFSSSGSLSVR